MQGRSTAAEPASRAARRRAGLALAPSLCTQPTTPPACLPAGVGQRARGHHPRPLHLHLRPTRQPQRGAWPAPALSSSSWARLRMLGRGTPWLGLRGMCCRRCCWPSPSRSTARCAPVWSTRTCSCYRPSSVACRTSCVRWLTSTRSSTFTTSRTGGWRLLPDLFALACRSARSTPPHRTRPFYRAACMPRQQSGRLAGGGGAGRGTRGGSPAHLPPTFHCAAAATSAPTLTTRACATWRWRRRGTASQVWAGCGGLGAVAAAAGRLAGPAETQQPTSWLPPHARPPCASSKTHPLPTRPASPPPGEVLFGTDSHTCNAGAFGQFATGVGNTDAGFILGTGKLLIKVRRRSSSRRQGSGTGKGGGGGSSLQGQKGTAKLLIKVRRSSTSRQR